MKRMLLFLFPLLAVFSSCGKKEAAPPATPAPTNITLTAVVNPDKSGNVNFTAAANNATTYEFDFGNGIYQTVPSGVVLYRYPASGTYTVNVLAKNSGGSISKSVVIIVIVEQSLIWSDEFNQNGAPDPAKWGYDLGAGGWGNQELQYYTNRSENSVVSNGTLKINAIRENYSASIFTSARLLTKDKFAFKYGKVEVRAKVPAGVGTWAAAWMLGSDNATVGWPACGELDIMEHLGRELNKIYATLHYPGRSGGSADGNSRMITNASTEFHVYSVDWTAAYIRIYVDDLLIHSVTNTTAIPFNHNFFIILNLAMGGNFGGPVDPAVTGGTLEVDYVRVYQ